MTPSVTKNPSNIFSAEKNLMLYYTYTNIDEAVKLGNTLMKDIEETMPAHSKEILTMNAVSLNILQLW